MTEKMKIILPLTLAVSLFAGDSKVMAAGCEFKNGFLTVSSNNPEIGQCKDNEHLNNNTKKMEQNTANGRLEFDGKNITFTAGNVTEVLGPDNLLNSLGDLQNPSKASVLCSINNGFGALAKLIPAESVGDCSSNEITTNNITVQNTTKGEFISDGDIKYTDGSSTWILKPEGVKHRLNSERFVWEKDKPDGVKIINELTDPAVKAANLDRFLQKSGTSRSSTIKYGPKESPYYAITFDDGLIPANRWRILNTLIKLNRHATFFYNWVNIKDDPAFIKAVLDSGSEFGNHTLDHPHLANQTLGEILDGDLHGSFGATTKPYFRYPYLEENTQSDRRIASLGYYDIGTSLDCHDYNYGREFASFIINCVGNKLLADPNANIGLNHSQSGATVEGLEGEIALIENITHKKVGSLSELFSFQG